MRPLSKADAKYIYWRDNGPRRFGTMRPSDKKFMKKARRRFLNNPKSWR